MIDYVRHDLRIEPTRDELSRQRFVSEIRRHILGDLANGMRATYHRKVEPALVRENGREPADGVEVHRAMRGESSYRFYSAMRVNCQKLVWRSVIPTIERNLERPEPQGRRRGRQWGRTRRFGYARSGRGNAAVCGQPRRAPDAGLLSHGVRRRRRVRGRALRQRRRPCTAWGCSAASRDDIGGSASRGSFRSNSRTFGRAASWIWVAPSVPNTLALGAHLTRMRRSMRWTWPRRFCVTPMRAAESLGVAGALTGKWTRLALRF